MNKGGQEGVEVGREKRRKRATQSNYLSNVWWGGGRNAFFCG